MPDVQGPAVLGVDVGGTKVAAARVHGREVLNPVERPTDVDSPQELIEGIEAVVRDAIEASGPPEAIGVGLPSQIDFATGTIVSSVNIPLAGVALGEELSNRFDVPVFVDNDANCAALAEAHHAGETLARHLVMYTLGTGVGGGVVIDGRIFRGATGLGAELGHVVVWADGPECPGNCPSRGCLEALCSGTALEREATALAGRRPDSKLGELQRDHGRVTGKQAVALAREGDAHAVGLLERLGTWLGVGLAGAINTFEPEHIVIGGGLSAAGDLFMPAAVREARSRALPALSERVEISLARAGPAAGVIGAGLLAVQELARTRDTAHLKAGEGVT
jgi:glucokinase